MNPARPFRAPLLLAAALLACAPAPAGRTVSLGIEVFARDLVPGEPLRIRVVSTVPLESLAGEFLGGPVFMVRAGGGEREQVWSGWSMIPLDQEPGVTSIEMRGSAPGGLAGLGSRALTILAKDFPVEHLDVASKYVEPPPQVAARLAREREKLAGIYRARRAVVPAREPFAAPLPGEPTSVFGMRRIFNGEPRSPHPGLDLRAATGTDVGASGAGVVVLSQDLYYSGNTVIVDHGGGLFTIYAHLSRLSVEESQRVASGDLLGLSGATGRVTGPHLHWGAKIGDRPFDPRALLNASLFR